MIQLVVDSTCDMPKSVISDYGIKVLPLQVVIDGTPYRDGVDITSEELYGVLEQGVFPQTSQISAVETDEVFRRACEEGKDLIFLSFSSEMSGTYQLACNVAESVSKDYPERRIEVIDSEGGCMATGLIAMQAARWIADGKDMDETVSLMVEMISKIQHLFTLDSLDWLAKGGRVPKPAGWVGDALNVKPILHVADKTMHVVRVVRGRKKTIKTLIEMLKERSNGFNDQLIGITHAKDEDAAESVSDMILEALPGCKTVVLPIGCVLATHLGIGGIGIFFLSGPVPEYDLLDCDFS